MNTPENIITLPLTKGNIIHAIIKAKENAFVDNLRNRHPLVQLDSKIRGYMGEKAVRNWFAQYDILFEEAKHSLDSTGMDIDLLYKTEKGAYNLEVKTSLVPDRWGHLNACLQKGDIKLIRRGNTGIEELSGDLHLQIYYGMLRKARDRFVENLSEKVAELPPENIFKHLRAGDYINNTFLVAWIDKPSLVELVKSKKKDKMWRFGMRTFWKCNLSREARKPREMVDYIKAL